MQVADVDAKQRDRVIRVELDHRVGASAVHEHEQVVTVAAGHVLRPYGFHVRQRTSSSVLPSRAG